MEVKKRSGSNVSRGISNLFHSLWNLLTSRKFKVFSGVIIVIGFIFMGFIAGIAFFGVFGTFENPSQRTISLMHFFGIGGLRDIQSKIDSIRAENINIPLNYIKGKTSNPEKITIDINFENYQRLEFKRQEAIKTGLLVTSDADQIPAEISYGGNKYKADIRLKGDNTDHVNSDKFSLAVKIKNGESLMGMSKFSLMNPERRQNVNEWIYMAALNREDVLGMRYKFVEVIINGDNKGIYALEESFDKNLIEYNQRRDGPIIKLDADEKRSSQFSKELTNYSVVFSEGFDFYPSARLSISKPSTLADPLREKQFNEAKNLLESFRMGRISTSDAFNTDVLARYFAVTTLFGAHHAALWSNIVFYFNPITGKLEPIGYDAEIGNNLYEGIESYTTNCFRQDPECKIEQNDFTGMIFSDKEFFEKYMKELKRVSDRSYLDNFFSGIDSSLKKNIDIMHSDYPAYHFPKERFYEFRDMLENDLSPELPLNAYFQGLNEDKNKLVIYIGNGANLPIEIIEGITNESKFPTNQQGVINKIKAGSLPEYKKFEFDIPYEVSWKNEILDSFKIKYKFVGKEEYYFADVIPWKYIEPNFSENSFIMRKPNYDKFDLIEVSESSKTLSIKAGEWTLNESLIIPEGYTLRAREDTKINLNNGAVIFSRSPLIFKGYERNKITITTSDGTGQGVVIMGAEKESSLSNVIFDGLNYPVKGNWELTGAVNVFDSPIVMKNVTIQNTKSEDGINVVRSKFDFDGLTIKNTTGDCYDVDFGNGDISNFNLINCGNDGLDFSGSTMIIIKNGMITKQGDKGISIGERANATISNLIVREGFIGLGSKDQSDVRVNNVTLIANKYGITAYQKKPEYGPGYIKADNITFIANEFDTFVERKSQVYVNNKLILDNKKNVYGVLYPGE